ncbi:MAG: leucine-rich repeat domain-containing protein [Lachnospiraceae bacterium]|nr:leucine-rich repeat domain-containing protein [Lachnospiraceae bacterium]
MSINLMEVYFQCPKCGHRSVALDYHENESSDRSECFEVLNAGEGFVVDGVIYDNCYHCPACKTEYSLSEIFTRGCCSVEDIDAYKRILMRGLERCSRDGHISFSDWSNDWTEQPALDRLCAMYPEDEDFRKLRQVYSDIHLCGSRGLKSYSKLEVYNGTVEAYQVYYAPLLKKVYLHDGVKAIGKAAFKGCVNLKDIFLPSSITSIGEEAFAGCCKLRTIHVSDEIVEIGKRAFWGCGSLTSFFTPHKLKMTGEECFWGCRSLRRFWLPDGVMIGRNAFYGCLNLVVMELSVSTDEAQIAQSGLLEETQIVKYNPGESASSFRNTEAP